MQPDPSYLLNQLNIALPPVGVYDAPDPAAFAPLVEPTSKGRSQCVFSFYKKWLDGATLHVTRESYGCGGAGRALCGVQTRDRGDFIHFLAVEEGLKVSEELMGRWVDANPGYQMEHGHVLVGPLKPQQYPYLKTVTLWVNPDQLSALTLGAQYRAAPDDPPPVVARFGAGCGQLLTVFDDLGAPQAQIGTTDIAMRQWLPADLLAFTVTRPLFEQLCGFGDESYLTKPFLKRLKKSRGGTL